MAEFEIKTDLKTIQEQSVAANFDEALAAVRELVAPYKAMVVTPDTLKNAEKDRAALRRMRDRFEETRKAVKKACMEPYTRFETQIKEITGEIDGAVENIDDQVKAFEEQARNEKMTRLRAYFDAVNAKSAEGFAEFDKIAAKHPDWKNKGCSEEKAQNDIQLELANVEMGLQALRSPAYGPHVDAMMERFAQSYNLADAINTYNQIKRREERRVEAEQRASRQAVRPQQTEQNAPTYETTREAEERPAEAAQSAPETIPAQEPELKRIEFWVEITREQGRLLGAFLRSNGIRYGSVKK